MRARENKKLCKKEIMEKKKEIMEKKKKSWVYHMAYMGAMFTWS